MKKLITIFAIVALVLTITIPTKAAITLTFEEFLGNNGATLGSYYYGITFEAASTGQDWVAGDGTTGLYNVSSWPSGTILGGGGQYWIYDDVFAWTGVVGDNGKISFDNQDATFVEFGYSAYDSGGGIALYLEAYDAYGNLLDSDSGVSNLRFIDGNGSGPGTLRVDWDGSNPIAYVLIHDTGNYWCIDNLVTDASGINIIPAPGAILLGSIGVGLVGWLKRRRTL